MSFFIEVIPLERAYITICLIVALIIDVFEKVWA